jgi:hypothetical protein
VTGVPVMSSVGVMTAVLVGVAVASVFLTTLAAVAAVAVFVVVLPVGGVASVLVLGGHDVRRVVVVVGAVIRRRVVLVISAHAPPNLAQSSRVPHHANVEPHLLPLLLRAPIAVFQLRAVPSAGRHAGAAKGRKKARTAKGRRDRTWQQEP